MNEWEAYRPDFPAEQWTEDERYLLSPFVTNLDGHVSVLHNLPPEIVGALCSRTSRVSGSLTRTLYDEYLKPILQGDDAALAQELRDTVAFLHAHGFKNIMNNQRAQDFYAKWYSQFGDDSIAQLTGTHVVFRGISQVAIKFLEDQRLGLEPIEKSTRYVNFGGKIGGHYLYYTPPDLKTLGLFADYERTMDYLFDTYVALVGKLKEWLKANYQEKEGVLEKKAFDALRGLLPMATLGQVAFRGNAQAFEYAINRTASSELGEFRWISRALKEELDKEIPSLLLRLKEDKSVRYQQYLAGRKQNARIVAEKIAPELFRHDPIPSDAGSHVALVEYDPEGEDKLAAAILIEISEGKGGWNECLGAARKLSAEDKERLFASYLQGRTERWQKVGRAFENSMVRFEILMNAGAYRDLHRHRPATQERQNFTVHHGYSVPPEVRDAGLEAEYREALERVVPLFDRLAAHAKQLAQYVVPLACRVRFYQYQSIRQCFWEMEIRTGPQGHPDYRTVEQEKFKLLQEKFPLAAKFMLVDMKRYDFARRGAEEAIQRREEKIIKGLQGK